MPDTAASRAAAIAEPVSILRRPLGKVIDSHRQTILKAARIVVALLLAGYCLVGAIMLPFGSAKLIPDQQENTYPESSILYEAVLSAKTGHLYFPLYARPYLSQPYGPLFYLIDKKIAQSAHSDLDATMVRVRSLVFASFLACSFVVFLLCRKLGFSIPMGALAALLTLGYPSFTFWNASARPDVPCLLAMLLCIYCSLILGNHRKIALLSSGAFGATAILLKQTGIAAPFAVAATLLWKRRFREAFLLLGSSAVPVALTYCSLWWRREPFIDQALSVGKGGLWSISSGAQWVRTEMLKAPILLPLAMGCIGAILALRRDERSQTAVAFAGTAWAIFLLTISQRGASENYLLPGLVGCALLLPYAIDFARYHLTKALPMVVIAVVLAWGIWSLAEREKRLFVGHLKSQRVAYTVLRPYRILSDNPFFTLQGRDPELLDPFLFHSLELAGHWSSVPIAEELKNQEIDLVILSCSWHAIVCSYRGVAFFSTDILREISANYSVLCSTPQSWVLRPRGRPIDEEPEMFAPILNAPCGTRRRGEQLRFDVAPGIR